MEKGCDLQLERNVEQPISEGEGHIIPWCFQSMKQDHMTIGSSSQEMTAVSAEPFDVSLECQGHDPLLSSQMVISAAVHVRAQDRDWIVACL